MDSRVMDIDCYSQQGSARETNRDFVGLFELDCGVLVYLLDVSTSSSLNCASFVEQLNGLILERVTNESVAEPSLFLEVFQQVIIELQQSFKSGVASLITCFVSYESGNVWGYTVGDSRIGTVRDEIIWLSPVHTGANPFGESFIDSMKLLPERHILTRSLNMRKKYNPELFQFNIAKEQSLVVASDGFWAELTSELQLSLLAKQQVQTEDDSSVIAIKDFIGAANLNCTVLSGNCNYFNLTNKG
ncbi:hypothetical protein ACT3S9_08305 [Pseudoalteromonas sp. AOP31-A2-14]|uniref:hypothetical protein n=2 Tax=unclassified Pseudoalteromonas TaxID=194690 RepID=UPI003FB6930A|tara:strand:+ start:1698 stop:2432 length:735 start_codon:yes stop_codon:yes gene_type:complete